MMMEQPRLARARIPLDKINIVQNTVEVYACTLRDIYIMNILPEAARLLPHGPPRRRAIFLI